MSLTFSLWHSVRLTPLNLSVAVPAVTLIFSFILVKIVE